MAEYLLNEDGTSKFILEDSSGDILLEVSSPDITPGFIASTTTVYTPTVNALGFAPSFIASVTAVYTPTVQDANVYAPFISSVTAAYAPAINFITNGLIRWYKADDLGLSDGSLVSTWYDRSGNGADLTAAGGARPTLATGRLNGQPGIVFSGAQKMGSTASGQPTSDVTVFAVVSNYKRGSFPQFVTWGSGGTNGFNLYANSGTLADEMPPAFIALRGGSWGDNWAAGAAKPARGDPIILTGQTDGSTTRIRIDRANQIDDSSASSSAIDYGGGTIELALGAKQSGSYLEGEIFEVLIYDRTLTPAEIATVEEYLDAKWGVTERHAAYHSLYNGSDQGGHYSIGLAWSADGKRWHRSYANPVFPYAGGSAWDKDYVKDPNVVWDGTHFVLYYSGSNDSGATFQLGRATSYDLVNWTREASNPVIAKGGAGSIDEHGQNFPTVVYDLAETDPTRRWKCWYGVVNASGTYHIAYAYSSDGITWTKYGTVLSKGAGGAWDAAGIIPGAVWFDGSTWYLFYGGWQNLGGPNERFQGGIATFTNPESTYTKYGSNPTILARYHDSGTSENLTNDLLAGDRTVLVADTSGFNVHEPVFLDKTQSSVTAAPEYNRILSIDSSTQITLEWPVDNRYNVGDSGRIVSALYNSVVTRGIRQLGDGTYELHVVPFEPTNDLTHSDQNAILREMSMRATLATLTSNAVYDYQSGLAMMLADVGRWDLSSAENWSQVLDQVPQPKFDAPFIASATLVYTPHYVGGPHTEAPFIASNSTLYAPGLGLTGNLTVTTPGTYVWACPPGVTSVAVEAYGGGGGGAGGQSNKGYSGGGGGAYAFDGAIPVTPGTTYTFVVGAGGLAGNSPANPGGATDNPGLDGADSSFVGDSGNQVVAKAGHGGGATGTAGAGGSAASSTGATKHSGGDGGSGFHASASGAGGGASGNKLADGAVGQDDGVGTRLGGVGANGGGSGGQGSGNHANNATAGSLPGGGGGGGANGFSNTEGGAPGAGGQVTITCGVLAPYIASNSLVYTPTLSHPEVDATFIPSATVVYTPIVQGTYIPAPFIDSATVVYPPTLRRTFAASAVSQISLEATMSNTDTPANVSQVCLEVLIPIPTGLRVWSRV